MSKEHKHDEQKKPEAPAKKVAGPITGGCVCWGCKKSEWKFSFCQEHYDHFKFGLIKKTGEPVSDYEKKFEHYVAHQRKRGVQKVA